MGVTQSALSSITTTYSVKFREGLTNIQTAMPWQRLADETTSNGRETTYPIRGRSYKMRQWVGERLIRELEIYGYTLKNAKFENTIGVFLDDLDDDQYGLYNTGMMQLGEGAGRLPFDEIITAIKQGTSQLCFDGQYFFDTDHPVDPLGGVATTYANLFTSRSLTAANVNYVRTQMSTITDQTGEVMGVSPTTLVVPEALRKTGEEIVKGGLIMQTQTITQDVAAAPTNVMQGALDLMVLPQLDADSATSWYLADLGQSVKPFFWQWRLRPLFQRLVDMNSEYVITNDKILFGAKARGAAGYGLPQLMARANA